MYCLKLKIYRNELLEECLWCGVSRVDGVSNESVYERFGMSHVGVGKKCGVVEEETLKWFGHTHGANGRG